MKKNLQVKFYKKNDFWIRFSLSILFLAIFIILFFTLGGSYFLKKTKTVDNFVGNDFQLHVIDVGQADCLFLIFPDNTTMLIDTGTEKTSEEVVNYIKTTLSKEKINGIDYLLLTHQDADHIGGAVEILNNFSVSFVMRPKIYSNIEVDLGLNLHNYKISDSLTFNEVISTAINNNCKFIFNEKDLCFMFGECSVEFLSPSQDTYTDSNNYSAVVMITYQNKKFLFMGDAEGRIEEELIKNYGEYLKADVLKIAHHGSETSSSKEFIQVVNPSYSIICAKANADLPSVETLNNLHDVDSKILSTAIDGSFALSVENNIIVYSFINKPSFDIAILISITVLILILLWGIKFDIKMYNKKNIQLMEDLND